MKNDKIKELNSSKDNEVSWMDVLAYHSRNFLENLKEIVLIIKWTICAFGFSNVRLNTITSYDF